jgi:hypothetical protein
MRRLLIVPLFAVLLATVSCGHFKKSQTYVAVKTTKLNNAAEVVTVQQPATGARTVRFLGAWLDCSVACTATLERNGTAASSTTLATAQVNPSVGTASTATAWSSSNVGAGTVIGAYSIPGAGGIPIGLTGIDNVGNGTAKNLTIRTNSITGTVDIIFKWQEVN